MPRLIVRLALLSISIVLSGWAWAGSGALQCPPLSTALAECCDPLFEPNLAGTQACAGGFACCSSGEWQCDSALGETTCDATGVVGSRCCNDVDEPGQFDNPPCFEGATCCSTGQWQCNDATGQATCSTVSESCATRCCDPLREPGTGDNPTCFEGTTCCADGDWTCNDSTGGSTCHAEGERCEQCCDLLDEPGRYGNPTCFEGANCCSTGEWQCNDATGHPTCDIRGQVCRQECCDPLTEPGASGSAPCIEGATCCGDGTWSCNDGTGRSTCTTPGDICDPPCCDAADRPDLDETAACATGFSCCGDGTWRCNDSDGLSTCSDGAGVECPRQCGGIAGMPCHDDEFCRLPIGACCCDIVGICVDIPQACPDIYDPVCGCDGRTYSNRCEADAASVSIEHRGACPQVCGGFAGGECPDGEFCLLADGECCCDFEGICEPIPDACPLICDPVCGCDGTTYSNRCKAAAAGVSVEHPGACNEGGGLVSGVVFPPHNFMKWEATPGALTYNLYGRPIHESPPEDYGRCLFHGLEETGLHLPILPNPGVLWIFQVTGVFEEGEGTMGIAHGCREREPAAPCTCTLPPAVGPCDAAIPRWYHDSVSGQCEMFVWGGCGGNSNNFESLSDCEAKCER